MHLPYYTTPDALCSTDDTTPETDLRRPTSGVLKTCVYIFNIGIHGPPPLQIRILWWASYSTVHIYIIYGNSSKKNHVGGAAFYTYIHYLYTPYDRKPAIYIGFYDARQFGNTAQYYYLQIIFSLEFMAGLV